MTTLTPLSRRRLTLALSATSEPVTLYPRLDSTSAMPLMPMPPMPTKWTGPMSRGSFIRSPLPPRYALARAVAMAAGDARLKQGRPRTEWLMPADLQHKVGQLLGRGRGARSFSRGCHAGKPCGLAQERRDFQGQSFGREVALFNPDCATGFGENARVFELILIKRMRQRYQNGRTANGGQFSNCRGTGARDDQLRRRHTRRQVRKKRSNLALDTKFAIGRANGVGVFRPCLLHDR